MAGALERERIVELQEGLPVDAPAQQRAAPLDAPVVGAARLHREGGGLHADLGVREVHARGDQVRGGQPQLLGRALRLVLERLQRGRVHVLAREHRQRVVPPAMHQHVPGAWVRAVAEQLQADVALGVLRAHVELDGHVVRQPRLEPERVVLHLGGEQLAVDHAPVAADGEEVALHHGGIREVLLVGHLGGDVGLAAQQRVVEQRELRHQEDGREDGPAAKRQPLGLLPRRERGRGRRALRRGRGPRGSSPGRSPRASRVQPPGSSPG